MAKLMRATPTTQICGIRRQPSPRPSPKGRWRVSCSLSAFRTVKGLTGKNALVTGSGTGIGKGISLEFAREGANVAFHGRTFVCDGGSSSLMSLVPDFRNESKLRFGMQYM